jgi:hypothetical protein
MQEVGVKIKVQTEGQQQLAAVKQQLAGVTSEVRQADGALKAMDKSGDTLASTVADLRKQLDQLRATTKAVSDESKKSADAVDDSSKKLKQAEQVGRTLGDSLQNTIAGAAGVSREMLVMGGSVTVAAGALLAGANAAYTLVAAEGALAEATSNTAVRLGLSIGETERLQAAARVAGVSLGTLEGAAVAMASGLEEGGVKGDKIRKALAELEVKTLDASGAEREYGQILLDTLVALSKVEDGNRRVALAREALTKGGAKVLAPLIADYEALSEAVTKLGIGLNESLTKNLANADDQIGLMKESWAQFKKSLADKIAPIVIPVVTTITGALSGQLNAPVDPGPRKNLDPFVAPPDPLGLKIRIKGDPADLSAQFAQRQAGTKDGLQRRLREVEADYRKLDEELRSGQLGESAFRERERKLDALAKERSTIEARLSALGKKPKEESEQGSLRLSDLFAKDADERGREIERRLKKNAPSLFGRRTEQGDPVAGGVLRVTEFGPDPNGQGQEKTLADGLVKSLELRQRIAEQTKQIQLDGQIRLIELTERNEYEAARKVYELRQSAAETTLDAKRAEIDYELKIAEIAKQRSERYREDAGRVFDAITSRGGGGLRDFLGGFVKQQERAVFQNISQGIFEKAGGILGKVGQASGLGGLLKGTIFDPQNAQTPEMRSREKNTLAIEQNTAALQGRVPITGNPGIDSILGQLPGTRPPFVGGSGGGGFLSRLFGRGASSGSSKNGFVAGVGSVFAKDGLGLFGGLRGGQFGGSASERAGNVVGSAALVGAGTYGIVSGVKQGGAQGALTAVQGGLSIAAAVPGPQQPFIQAAALVAGLVKGLFPDSKQQRENEIRDEVAKRKYNAPSAIDRVQDRDGNALDYDANGNLRKAGGVTVIQNFNAIDAKSFLDRSSEVAGALLKEFKVGNDALIVGTRKAVVGVP